MSFKDVAKKAKGGKPNFKGKEDMPEKGGKDFPPKKKGGFKQAVKNAKKKCKGKKC